jgi:hypothetical protein
MRCASFHHLVRPFSYYDNHPQPPNTGGVAYFVAPFLISFLTHTAIITNRTGMVMVRSPTVQGW